jgi:hypothetical protein
MPMSESRTTTDVPLDERRYALDHARLEVDRKRLELEQSWPRKWGSVLLSAGATLSVAIITAGMSLMQMRTATAERQEAERNRQQIDHRAAQDAAAQRRVENDRTALDMYFRYVADKPEDQPHRVDHILLVESIASDRKLLDRLGAQQTRAVLESRTDVAPSTAVAGLPDLQSQPADHVYRAQDFTTYIQYLEGRDGDAERVAEALRALGTKVPRMQAIAPGRAPRLNQIRIYRVAHRPYAERLAGYLRQKTGLVFMVQSIAGDRLPNGIGEIWLGKTI